MSLYSILLFLLQLWLVDGVRQFLNIDQASIMRDDPFGRPDTGKSIHSYRIPPLSEAEKMMGFNFQPGYPIDLSKRSSDPTNSKSSEGLPTSGEIPKINHHSTQSSSKHSSPEKLELESVYTAIANKKLFPSPSQIPISLPVGKQFVQSSFGFEVHQKDTTMELKPIVEEVALTERKAVHART